jgi:NAD(P)-dependent dehydrogenase (short-subunit alcohol dehydrogenase family)
MRHNDDSIRGLHVLVTGAASGIGRATALELARRGASISLADIDEHGALEVASIARRTGATARAYAVDMAKPDGVRGLAVSVVRDGGPVDVLVNNAGVAVVAPFLRTTEEDWRWVEAVNLRGPIELTRALLPEMVRRGRGHVVMVASLAGLVGAPGMVAYTTTKFALVGFAEALRLEAQPSGVGVTVVCPGFVRTNLAKSSRYDNSDFRRFLSAPPSWYGLSKDRVGRRIVDALVAKDPLLVLGPEKLGWWLKRLAPEAAFAVTSWAARRAGIGFDKDIDRVTPHESQGGLS